MPEKRKIIYIGVDQRFWKNIKLEIIDSYGKDRFEFEEWFAEGEKSYLTYYRKVIRKTPSLIYIDYSENSDSHMQFSFLIANSNTTRFIPIIGLHPHDTKDFQIKKSISYGVNINHIKSGTDCFDTVYTAFNLAFPKEIVKSPYFLAYYIGGRESQLRETVRINYLTEDYLHIECSETLIENSMINLESALPPDLVPSNEYMVSGISRGDHYYNFEKKAKLEYQYLDLIKEPKEKEIKEENKEEKLIEIKAQIKSREFKLKDYKKKFSRWIKEMGEKSIPKHLKIMVIDEKYEILDQAESWIDEYPYSFRLQTILSDPLKEIGHYRPNFIMFNYDEPEKTIDEFESHNTKQNKDSDGTVYNDINSLGLLINNIKKIANYEPVIVSFNTTQYSSSSLQDFYQYKKIMVNPRPISFEMILNMASTYENKFKFFNPATMEHAHKFFISKNDPLSYAMILHKIKLLAISETDVYISSRTKLPLYSNYMIKSPAEFLITIVPNDKVAGPLTGPDCYRGIIHSIKDSQKEILRKHIILETSKSKGKKN